MKKEKSSYVHQYVDETFAEYSFLNLPPRPTVQEQRLVVVPGATERQTLIQEHENRLDFLRLLEHSQTELSEDIPSQIRWTTNHSWLGA
jgi:hypothetical protein